MVFSRLSLKQLLSIQINPLRICVNFKNTKTARKKLPHEATEATKWIPKKKAQTLEEESYDKLFEQRKIVDPVWLMKEYKPQLLKLEDAINFHKEFAQPEMINNLEGFLQVRLSLDMTTKKKTKFMDNIKGTVFYPNFFNEGIKKEVIAICKNEKQIEESLKNGALMAGHTDILKKLEKGEIPEQSYDFLVCTPDTFADVMLIKKKLNKDKLPTLKANTVTEDIANTVMKLHFSKDYESAKVKDEFAILKTKIGLLGFETQQLVENFAALINKVMNHKMYAANTFITECVLYSAPSTEKFKVDFSRFLRITENDAETSDKQHEENESEQNPTPN